MRISIRNMGLGIGAVLTLLVASVTAVVVRDKLEESTLAKRGLEVTVALELGYRALMPMSLERSVTQVGLTLDTPLPPQFASLRMEQRRISEQQLDALLAHLESAVDLKNKQETINALRTARANLSALRSRADTAVSVPRRERASNVDALPQEIIAAIRGMQSILAGMIETSAIRAADAEEAVQAAYRAWRIREYEGQSRTYLAVALLHNQAMSPAAMKAASELTGRAEAAFEALSTLRRTLPEGVLPAFERIVSAYG